MWNIPSLVWKQPELVFGVERYQQDIVVLNPHTVWALKSNSWRMGWK